MSHKRKRVVACRSGFTLLELFVVIVIIGIIIGMLLPAVQRSRSLTGREACSNNLRQIGVAVHNYESSHMHFPLAMGGVENGSDRLSGLVTLLPFLDQEKLWDTVSSPSTIDGVDFTPGPSPLHVNFTPWQTSIEVFQCPSADETLGPYGRTNYAFSIGDVARDIHNPTQLRGAFSCRLKTRWENFSDGSSNTIGLAEIGTSSDRAVIAQFAISQPVRVLDDPSECFKLIEDSSDTSRNLRRDLELGTPGRGGCWADGAAGSGLVNTVLPPNSPSCAVGGQQAVDGIYSAGSRHRGGIQVVCMDSSTHFINYDIDAGDSSQPVLNLDQLSAGTVASPYGAWGALGSINDGELVSIGDW